MLIEALMRQHAAPDVNAALEAALQREQARAEGDDVLLQALMRQEKMR
ncbi:MAG: hypothetical protein ACRDIC_20955 [bacterium]